MAFTELEATTLGAILEGLFYGAYVVLFILYLVLRHRSHRVVDGPLTLAQILLFSLCTLCFCFDISGYYFLVVPDVASKDTFEKLTIGSMVPFAIVDFLAQMILLYRCWIIWDRRWVVVVVPGFLAFVTLGAGFVLVGLRSTGQEKFIQLYSSIGAMAYSVSLGVNALTTSLIVIKIYLTSREVHPALGSNSNRSLRIVTTMLIESGLLMFTFQLVYVILFAAHLTASDVIAGPIAHIYGITPTLLGIRAVIGTAHDTTTEKTRSLRFAHSRGAATQTTGAGISAAGVQSRAVDIDLDEVSDNTSAAV